MDNTVKEPATTSESLTLLLVADDLMFPSRVREGARPKGYTVTVTATESTTMAAATALPHPSAILVNLTARRYDPLQIIRQLKAEPATRDIPLLAFAGHTETEKHQEARRAGADRTAANSSISLHLIALLERLLRPSEKEDSDHVLEIEA